MPETLKIDPSHSNIGFSAKHLVVTTVHGQFTDFDANIEVEGEDHNTLKVDVVIRTASVNTNEARRDGHLRSADFFDSEKYPEMRFVSTGAEKHGEDHYLLRGDLTIKDVTRPVELEANVEGKFNDPYGNERTGVTLRGEINREDWGLSWNQVYEAGAVMVSKKIRLEIDVAVLRPLAVPAL
ncbi:MAG: YceI family protein [Candidatus Dormibacteraeota bacterium]|nr:YceI family protein [Candidatus Dormibacteraeota bacterium]